ncbi:MAG TPA: hydrogenase, partial [Sulfuricurvum sp.]|nr:hydrogenase [Sulfuricurvum sp.]
MKPPLRRTSTMPSRPSKPRLLWLQGVTCNGNTHAFLNLPWLDALLERFDIVYHPLLPSLHSLEAVAACNMTCDVLVFEGAFAPGLRRGEKALGALLEYYAQQASYVVAAGSCASFGGMFKDAIPEGSGLAFVHHEPGGPLAGHRVINLSGCPVHPEWLGYTLMMIADNETIALDALHRPKALYSHLAHDGCLRNEYFEWKVDAKQFGQKEGCLFYEHG